MAGRLLGTFRERIGLGPLLAALVLVTAISASCGKRGPAEPDKREKSGGQAAAAEPRPARVVGSVRDARRGRGVSPARVRMAPPGRLRAERVEGGLKLTWAPGRGIASKVVLLRKKRGGKFERLAEQTKSEFVDRRIEPFAFYTYRVTLASEEADVPADAEVTAFAGPAGVRACDLTLGPGPTTYDLIARKPGAAREDIALKSAASGEAVVATPGRAGIRVAGRRGLHAIRRAPADGYVASARLRVGETFFIRTADGRYAKVRIRAITPEGKVCASCVFQPSGGRDFPAGPAGLKGRFRHSGLLLEWRGDEGETRSCVVYRRRDFTEPWVERARLKHSPCLDVPPLWKTPYEYGVALVRPGEGSSDLAVLRVYLGDVASWFSRRPRPGAKLKVEEALEPKRKPAETIAFDGRNLWSWQEKSSQLLRYELPALELTLERELQDTAGVTGLVTDGLALWAGQRSGAFHLLDPRFRRVRSCRLPKGEETRLLGMAWDFLRLWVVRSDAGKLSVQTFTHRGAHDRTWPLPIRADRVGFTWDGRDFWLGFRKELVRLDAEMKILERMASPASDCAGLAWDGDYLWISDAGSGRIFRCSFEARAEK